jgi:CBS domain-containing protein/nitroimidazol reductase NimA-like FMN-containing flavoprotein (pyridoxamine 5'-phosphate oxidase superfamily)
MRGQELMTTPVVTVSPHMSVKEAATTLITHGITAAPVVDAADQLVGIVTEADLLRGRLVPDPRRHLNAAPQDSAPLGHEVSEVMSTPVHALSTTADVAEIARLMSVGRLRAVPLTEDGRVAGIVTRRDILRLVARDDAAVRAEVRTALAGAGEGSTLWGVDVAEGSVHLRGGGDPDLAAVRARTVPGVARVSVETLEDTSPRDRAGLLVLSFTDCIERLGSAKVGRVAFLDGAEILVLPVNHAMHGTTVVFRTAQGSKLSAADTGSTVAFEVDGYESVRELGWSVLVKGRAARVYDDETINQLERLGVEPWADAQQRPMWVRIAPTEITGRQIAG